jgi:phosphoribosylanthranilate isomerase
MVRVYGRRFVRTVGVTAGASEETVLEEVAQIIDATDAILFDSGRYGGTGTAHDWALTASVRSRISKPLILAGGLTPENCGKAIAQTRPWGIDVESGVERHFPVAGGGRVTAKDFSKIGDLVSAALRADQVR